MSSILGMGRAVWVTYDCKKYGSIKRKETIYIVKLSAPEMTSFTNNNISVIINDYFTVLKIYASKRVLFKKW